MPIKDAPVADAAARVDPRVGQPPSTGQLVDVAKLIDLCLAENRRRMSAYDHRLLRPFAVPALAGLVRRFMRS